MIMQISHEDFYNSKYVYNEFLITSISDLLNFRQFGGGCWVFRGQSDKNWKLTTSLERAVVKRRSDINVEKEIIEKFQRTANIYVNNPPERSNKLAWLSLIQHYGGPTRLLDFTSSLYIASYFAVEDTTMKSDAAIWAVNLLTLEDYIKNKHGIKYDEDQLNSEILNKSIGGKFNKQIVINLEPYQIEKRINAQKGTFLVPFDMTSSFEINLFKTFGVSTYHKNKVEPILIDDKILTYLSKISVVGGIVKIIIPSDLREELLFWLYDMNINAEKLNL